MSIEGAEFFLAREELPAAAETPGPAATGANPRSCE
jgi:hypothetical protein